MSSNSIFIKNLLAKTARKVALFLNGSLCTKSLRINIEKVGTTLQRLQQGYNNIKTANKRRKFSIKNM